MDIHYSKNKNELFFKTVEEIIDITNLQNYIPIFENFFVMTDTNYNKINLETKYQILNFIQKKTENIYLCNLKKKK